MKQEKKFHLELLFGYYPVMSDARLVFRNSRTTIYRILNAHFDFPALPPDAFFFIFMMIFIYLYDERFVEFVFHYRFCLYYTREWQIHLDQSEVALW